MTELNPLIFQSQVMVLGSLYLSPFREKGIDLDMSIVGEGIRIKDKFISVVFNGEMKERKKIM